MAGRCRFTPDHPAAPRPAAWLRTPPATVLATLSMLCAMAWTYGFLIHRRQVDFEVYLMGGRHFASPQLYTAVQVAWPHLPFTYPPFAALFFSPLAQLPYVVSQVLWSTANLGLLAALIAVSLATLRPLPPEEPAIDRWRLVALLLGPAVMLEPLVLDLSFGQINLLVTALMFADLTGSVGARGHQLPRGVLVGVAAALKLTPLIAVPFLFVTRQWRAARNGVVTFFVASVTPFIYNPEASRRYWTFYVTDIHRIGNAAYVSNQSLEGAVSRLAHHVVTGRLMTAATVVIVAVGLANAWRWWQRRSRFLSVLIVVVSGYVASPITWCHHMVGVVPLLLWMWWGSERLRFRRIITLFAAALLYVAPMWRIPVGGSNDLHEHGWTLLAGSSFLLAALVFLISTLIWSFRSPARLQPQ